METKDYPRFFVNQAKKIALVQLDELTIEEWIVQGRPNEKQFNHAHKRTTFNDNQILQQYLTDFEQSDVNEYWAFQFAHKDFDQYYHDRANDRKQKLYDNNLKK